MATIFGPYSPLTLKKYMCKASPRPHPIDNKFYNSRRVYYGHIDIAFSLSPTTKKHRRIINLGEGLYGHHDH